MDEDREQPQDQVFREGIGCVIATLVHEDVLHCGAILADASLLVGIGCNPWQAAVSRAKPFQRLRPRPDDWRVIRSGGQPSEQFLVDLAPAPPATDTEVRAWAAEQRVFVSSVMGGMTAEREAAVRAISNVGARPVWFEGFGGMDDDPGDAYTAQVASSDIYLGILGSRYGKPLKTGYSATHAECNPVRRGLRVSIWTTTADQDGSQRHFLDEIRVFHTTGTYTSANDLAERVEIRLRAIAADALAPWVKVGHTVFRASSIRDNGRTFTVVGRVRDNSVAASLLGRRPDTSYGNNAAPRMWRPGATAVGGVSVEEATTTTRGASNILIAEGRAEERRTILEMRREEGRPEDDIAVALRVLFFGENPLLEELAFKGDG